MNYSDICSHTVFSKGDARRYFTLARHASLKSNMRIRVGSVLVNQRDIVSVGTNSFKTHPRCMEVGQWTIHAEMDAVIGIDRRRVEGSTIWVYRERRVDDNIGMARPCSSCFKLLAEAGVYRVVYTNPNQKGGIGVEYVN